MELRIHGWIQRLYWPLLEQWSIPTWPQTIKVISNRQPACNQWIEQTKHILCDMNIKNIIKIRLHGRCWDVNKHDKIQSKYCLFKFTDIYHSCSKWQYVGFSLCDGLAMYRRQAVTHTKRSQQLTHWGRDEIDAISETTLSNAFSWMKP